MAKDNFSLLLVALVSMVAVVGLVILFNGQTTGASVCGAGASLCPTIEGGAMVCAPTGTCPVLSHGRPIGEAGDYKQRPLPYWQASPEYRAGKYQV